MAKLGNLVATVGSYTDREGNEKKRYAKVGSVHDGQYGKFIILDSIPFKEDGTLARFINIYTDDAGEREVEKEDAVLDNQKIPF